MLQVRVLPASLLQGYPGSVASWKMPLALNQTIVGSSPTRPTRKSDTVRFLIYSRSMGRGKRRHHGRIDMAVGVAPRGRYGRLTLDAQAGDLAERQCVHHGWTEHVLRVDKESKRWRCKQCDVARTTQRRILHKKTLIAEAGGQCGRCGYGKYYGALQFHHRDPAQKLYVISGKALNKPLDELRAEVQKCDLVCGNCHAELEYQIALTRAKDRQGELLVEEEGKLYGECGTHGRAEMYTSVEKGQTRVGCKRCRNEAVLRTQRKNKDRLIDEFGGKCQECGYGEYRGALQFHHRDTATKSFALSSVGSISYERLRAEAEKCDLLCSNCHSEHHAGEFEAEDVTAAAAA